MPLVDDDKMKAFMANVRKPASLHLHSNPDRDNQCWQWLGFSTRFGHYKIQTFMIMIAADYKPKKVSVTCGNYFCVNPKHLKVEDK